MRWLISAVMAMVTLGCSLATDDAALKATKALEKVALQELWLLENDVTDGGLKILHGLTELRRLDLRKTKVTDEGVAELMKALPNVKIVR